MRKKPSVQCLVESSAVETGLLQLVGASVCGTSDVVVRRRGPSSDALEIEGLLYSKSSGGKLGDVGDLGEGGEAESIRESAAMG